MASDHKALEHETRARFWALETHEAIVLEDDLIVRKVPSGWMYEYLTVENDGVEHTVATYVPDTRK